VLLPFVACHIEIFIAYVLTEASDTFMSYEIGALLSFGFWQLTLGLMLILFIFGD